ncbi:MAG: hypothetical protein LBU82_08905 [Treponema sp.]|jgi:hypothetical protein|nr:hypothetical protein [Treponema sp.]
MNSANYLEMLPLSGIAKYAKGRPDNGLPFTGHPRAHPSEKDKFILVNDPLGPDPLVLEFKLEDVLYVEDVPSAVTEAGEGVPLVRLWIKKGAIGMILEPFEVGDAEQLAVKARGTKERVARKMQDRPAL